MDGMIPLPRVGDDLVQDGAGEVLVPGHGALLRYDLDARRALGLGLEGDRDVAVARRAVEFLFGLSVRVLLDIGLRLSDLQVGKGSLGTAGGALNRDRHNRFDSPLVELDAPARSPPHGRHHAPRGEKQRTTGTDQRPVAHQSPLDWPEYTSVGAPPAPWGAPPVARIAGGRRRPL